MAKLYRAAVDFRCPADAHSFKNRKTGKGPVEWMWVKAGDKVEPYNDEILKSWVMNALVEGVGSDV